MMRSIQAAMLNFVLFFMLTSPTHAQQVQETNDQWHAREAAHYHACMAQTRTNPEAAFDDAVAWQGLGGGDPASHCRAAALMGMGHYLEAAQGLENLAVESKAAPDFKARLLVQSAKAWIAAQDPAQAREVANSALALAPDEPEALLARALALEALGEFWNMADDLNTVLSAYPAHVEALVLRGAAYRQLDSLDLALEDLNRALAFDAAHAEGLLERGTVYRLQGDKVAARVDWRKLIESQPKSAPAQKAAIDLYSMDSGAD